MGNSVHSLKKYALLISSALGAVLFGVMEFQFEQIPIIEGYSELPLESWQYSLCITTPEVLQAMGEPIYIENNPAFKIHFYLISLVIILVIVNVVCGFTRMLKDRITAKRDL